MAPPLVLGAALLPKKGLILMAISLRKVPGCAINKCDIFNHLSVNLSSLNEMALEWVRCIAVAKSASTDSDLIIINNTYSGLSSCYREADAKL